jgi:hypothetical protein
MYKDNHWRHSLFSRFSVDRIMSPEDQLGEDHGRSQKY